MAHQDRYDDIETSDGVVAQHDTAMAQDSDAVDPEAQTTTPSKSVDDAGLLSIAEHFWMYAVMAVLLFVAVIVVGWWAIIYGFAREYLVIEAFISLRHVPKDVYEKVGWSLYLPHL